MFLGAMPVKCIEQLFRVIDFSTWREAYICCSGTFRTESALRARSPDIELNSNDVSLYSCSIGRLAAGETMPILFRDRLAFVEDFLEGLDFIDRVAAVMVALDMSRFSRDNLFARRNFAYYHDNFATFHERAKTRLAETIGPLRLKGFFAGDWVQRVDHAIAADVGLVAYPPFYKGGYETMFKFIAANTDWEAPAYDLYDPDRLPEIIQRVHDAGIPYGIVSHQVWPDLPPPVAQFQAGRNVAHYFYARSERSSVRRFGSRADPFKYTAVDPSKLTKNSKVEIVPADGAKMNFLKDVYLAKHIVHATGEFNFLVYIDGMLAGGMIYKRDKYGGKGEPGIYLLSDFSVSREGRISKLIALLATGDDIIGHIKRRLLTDLLRVTTTAFSKHPVSMKYRGIFELAKRAEAPDGFQLQYTSAVRPKTSAQLYHEWFVKHANRQEGR